MKNEIIRVLLAEDDETDREDFIEAFKSFKIKTSVHTVNDGNELMKYLDEASVQPPHLLFLDLDMPKKSGRECLIEIRQIERFKHLTIVIYSISSSEKDIEDTFLNGANVYLKKPAELTMLKKILLHVLTLNWQYHSSGLNRDNYFLRL